MGYTFNCKKNKLKIGNYICYCGIEYVVAEMFKTKVVLLNREDVSLYRYNLINHCSHTGARYKHCNTMIKDIRELNGCEVY